MRHTQNKNKDNTTVNCTNVRKTSRKVTYSRIKWCKKHQVYVLLIRCQDCWTLRSQTSECLASQLTPLKPPTKMTSEDGRSGGVSKLDGVREICQPPLHSNPPRFWVDLTVPHRLRFADRLLRNNIIGDETINLFTILFYLAIIVMKNWTRVSQATAMHG